MSSFIMNRILYNIAVIHGRGVVMQVKNIELGTGAPKIVVSTSKDTHRGAADAARYFEQFRESFDILEIRADYFDELQDDAHINTVNEMIQAFSEYPVIYTYRSFREGGDGRRSKEDYHALLKRVIKECSIDLVDIEFLTDDGITADLIDRAEKREVKVLLSNHDFTCTPLIEEMQKLLYRMDRAGGDILKVAYAPQNENDTLNVMSVVASAKSVLGSKIVGISMGETGMITRLAGGTFGSCMTYGYVAETAAPGQVHAEKIRQALSAYE